MRDLTLVVLLSFFFTPLALYTLGVVDAQVRQSSNYQIQSDSINVGGGLSTSSNYSLESTVGEVATGDSDSSSYSLRAGYQQMQEVFISLTGAVDVTMTSLPGVSGGESTGSMTVTVLTDSPSGYELTIESSQSPAMQDGANTIADYVPVADPDADFSFTTGATDSHFGYTIDGIDTTSHFLSNGVDCSSGSIDSADTCFDGLSTTARAIAQGTSANHPNGATTTVDFRVGLGSSVNQVPGTYIATTTLTALPL